MADASRPRLGTQMVGCYGGAAPTPRIGSLARDAHRRLPMLLAPSGEHPLDIGFATAAPVAA